MRLKGLDKLNDFAGDAMLFVDSTQVGSAELDFWKLAVEQHAPLLERVLGLTSEGLVREEVPEMLGA